MFCLEATVTQFNVVRLQSLAAAEYGCKSVKQTVSHAVLYASQEGQC